MYLKIEIHKIRLFIMLDNIKKSMIILLKLTFAVLIFSSLLSDEVSIDFEK